MRIITRFYALFSAFVLVAGAPVASSAGECPVGQRVIASPRTIEDKPAHLLKRETLSEVSLKGWRGVGDLILRTRRLTIGPGGLVPTHYHNDRPSIVYIIKGEIVEHSTFCNVPILHKAGEFTPEFGNFHGHWWINNSTTEEVVLTSSDVIPPEQRDTPDPQ